MTYAESMLDQDEDNAQTLSKPPDIDNEEDIKLPSVLSAERPSRGADLPPTGNKAVHKSVRKNEDVVPAALQSSTQPAQPDFKMRVHGDLQYGSCLASAILAAKWTFGLLKGSELEAAKKVATNVRACLTRRLKSKLDRELVQAVQDYIKAGRWFTNETFLPVNGGNGSYHDTTVSTRQLPYLEHIQQLLCWGARVITKDGPSVLHMACVWLSNQSLLLVRLFLDWGADVNARQTPHEYSPHYIHPLQYALEVYNANKMKLLLDRGADARNILWRVFTLYDMQVTEVLTLLSAHGFRFRCQDQFSSMPYINPGPRMFQPDPSWSDIEKDVARPH